MRHRGVPLTRTRALEHDRGAHDQQDSLRVCDGECVNHVMSLSPTTVATDVWCSAHATLHRSMSRASHSVSSPIRFHRLIHGPNVVISVIEFGCQLDYSSATTDIPPIRQSTRWAPIPITLTLVSPTFAQTLRHPSYCSSAFPRTIARGCFCFYSRSRLRFRFRCLSSGGLRLRSRQERVSCLAAAACICYFGFNN